jgi:hypothetical protein
VADRLQVAGDCAGTEPSLASVRIGPSRRADPHGEYRKPTLMLFQM